MKLTASNFFYPLLNFLIIFFYPFFSLSQNSTNIGGVINSYTPIISYKICTNEILVEDASQFKVGDTVLVIQMKGAIVDSSNTMSFGNITDLKSCGNYAMNFIKNISGNSIQLINILTRLYDFPNGKVQLIRIPYYSNVNVTSTLKCLPWDGSKGGIIFLNVKDTINLLANIDVTGNGFRGGSISNQNSINICHAMNFFYSFASDSAGNKGEGITLLTNSLLKGRGKAANSGGGGNAHNAAGGGGGNYGSGGNGGKEFLCIYNPPQSDNGGIGGSSLQYSNSLNKIFLGGGGGAGEENDNLGSSGGNGGGIVILSAKAIKANKYQIFANGSPANSCLGFPCGDGMGGGGAGGVILLNINSYLDSVFLFATGGNGGSQNNPDYHGTGGGGSGGAILMTLSNIISNSIYNVQGGSKGILTSTGEDGGAQDGLPGGFLFNAKIPVDTLKFDTLQIITTKQNDINCNKSNSQLIASGAIQYLWSPSNSLNNPNIPNPIASPLNTTLYTVTGIDSSGCINTDTITIFVNTLKPEIDIVKENDINCNNPTSQLIASGAIQYSWAPTNFLNNSNISNPIASPPITTLYTVSGINTNGCIDTDTITVFVDTSNTGEFLLPNAFTPNGDGLNDCIRVKYWGVLLDFEFHIYNRWGQQVFHTTNPSSCWDGTINGLKQNSNVYVYWIKAKSDCSEDVIFRKGTIVLIR